MHQNVLVALDGCFFIAQLIFMQAGDFERNFPALFRGRGERAATCVHLEQLAIALGLQIQLLESAQRVLIVGLGLRDSAVFEQRVFEIAHPLDVHAAQAQP